jgi:hypothetical protein
MRSLNQFERVAQAVHEARTIRAGARRVRAMRNVREAEITMMHGIWRGMGKPDIVSLLLAMGLLRG